MKSIAERLHMDAMKMMVLMPGLASLPIELESITT